ncbi:MAG: hypothetical protein ACYDEQ_01905 [Desulfocucumaceae bacterium]
MNGINDRLNQIPEYREFEDMLLEGHDLLKEKGVEYSQRLKQYTRQLAEGEVNANEYRINVEGLQYEMKQWVNTQGIFKRRKMNKMINGVGMYVFNTLVNVIVTKFLS